VGSCGKAEASISKRVSQEDRRFPEEGSVKGTGNPRHRRREKAGEENWKNPHPAIHDLDSPLLENHQPSSNIIPPRFRNLPNNPCIKPRHPQTLNQKLFHIPRLHQRWKQLQRLGRVQSPRVPTNQLERRLKESRGRRQGEGRAC
jgi:hypothetical protein